MTPNGRISEFALDPDSLPVGVVAGSGMDLGSPSSERTRSRASNVVRALGPGYGCPPAHARGTPASMCESG
jgi:hypothetical protein